MLDLDRFKDVNDSLAIKLAMSYYKKLPYVCANESVHQILFVGWAAMNLLCWWKETLTSVPSIIWQKISCNCRQFPSILPNGRDVIIGASIGVSLYPMVIHQKILLQQGRCSNVSGQSQWVAVVSGISPMNQPNGRTTNLSEVRLRRAIELNELRVYFQPQMDILPIGIIGAEALVRWQDPNCGFNRPD